MAMTRRTVVLQPIQNAADRIAAAERMERWNKFAAIANEWAEKINNGIEDVGLWRKMRKQAAEFFDLEIPRNERARLDAADYMRAVERVNARRKPPTPKGG